MMRRLLFDRSGASAAEFAMVLPLLIMMLFAIIDGGRLLWTVNRAEKATQMGARFAVVTSPAASGMDSFNFVGVSWGGQTLTQGDVIPAGGFEVNCTSSACTCASCPTGMTVALETGTPSPFTRIADRMRLFYPEITDSNVRIKYSGSGLGYAGNPNGMDIAPLVTVELSGMQFQPVALLRVVSFPLPSFRTTLTAEDLSGTESN